MLHSDGRDGEARRRRCGIAVMLAGAAALAVWAAHDRASEPAVARAEPSIQSFIARHLKAAPECVFSDARSIPANSPEVTAQGFPTGSESQSRLILARAVKAEIAIRHASVRRYTSMLHGRARNRSRRVVGPRDDGIGAQAARALRANIEPLLEGEDVIAGREAWTVRLKPPKGYGWKQIWVEKGTGLVLAWREWTGDDRLKRTMKTESVSFGRQTAARAAAGTNLLASSMITGKSPRIAAGLRRARLIPRGFELVSVEVDKYAGDVHYVYSDGLLALSLFVLGGQRTVEDGLREWDQGLAFARRRPWGQVIVVGDVPAWEAEKIADSVR